MTGIVEDILPIEEFPGGFTKQTLVLTNDLDDGSKYPFHIPFTFKKERTQLSSACRKGQRVRIEFALDGRKWDGPRGVKYFADVVGLKITALDGAENVPAPAEPDGVETADPAFDPPF